MGSEAIPCPYPTSVTQALSSHFCRCVVLVTVRPTPGSAIACQKSHVPHGIKLHPEGSLQGLQGVGAGGWAEPGFHLTTHKQSETRTPPTTSDFSMLLISAKCPVCSSTATCPHALCEAVQAVFSQASLLYNPHLLI